MSSKSEIIITSSDPCFVECNHFPFLSFSLSPLFSEKATEGFGTCLQVDGYFLLIFGKYCNRR